MNYSGFMRPTWWWLRDQEWDRDIFHQAPAPLYSGPDLVDAMRRYRTGLPWDCVLHSWALLDSHDTPRFRTVAGSRARQLVGIGMQFTTPGVPKVFMGDELGLEGRWGEDARRGMPWGNPPDDLVDTYSRLAALRRSSEALATGGLRYVHVSNDAVAYLRETRDERVLCLAARADHDPIRTPFTSLETLYGDDATDGVLPSHGPAFHIWRIS
jgi:alpha-glucosidase